MAQPPLLTPDEGYDLLAPEYEQWDWQELWRRNERPILLDWFADLPEARSILDAGTGTGAYLKELVDRNIELTGVDISPRMIDIARRSLGERARLRVADIRQMPFAREEFDVVFCSRVLSHLRDPGEALCEIRRVTQRNGYILLSDVDGRHDYAYTKASVKGRPVSIKTYKHTSDELAQFLVASGFEILKSDSVSFGRLEWQPPVGSFASIDRFGARPIFFAFLARVSP